MAVIRKKKPESTTEDGATSQQEFVLDESARAEADERAADATVEPEAPEAPES